jgi:hypothetical protein
MVNRALFRLPLLPADHHVGKDSAPPSAAAHASAHPAVEVEGAGSG